MTIRGHKNYATWNVVQWLAGDERQYLAACRLAATNPTARQVADFVFHLMPRGTPGMDGPEDYLTVDWEAVREAVGEADCEADREKRTHGRNPR